MCSSCHPDHRWEVDIVCLTPSCESARINTIECVCEEVALLVESSWPNGRCSADYCPQCGCLGEARAEYRP